MNRKLFLASILPASAAFYAFKADAKLPILKPQPANQHKTPANLVSGDVIGITCPAGYITLDEITPAMQQFDSWGFSVAVGKTVGMRNFTFGGTDEERRSDFQQMLDDPSIKAIMCARGGYGIIRIIDQLDFTVFKKAPKWLIGFSDITILHCHLNTNYRIASIHSKMCNSFPTDWSTAEPVQVATIKSIEKALKGEAMSYTASYQINNRQGEAKGELVGGNLRCIETLTGSPSEIETAGKILFLEDTGEYLYSIDRMFYNLKRSGKLAKLKGLIIGGFRIKNDDVGDEFGKTLEQIVLEKVIEYNYPVCFDFPVGHQKANYALKCGVKHHLKVTDQDSVLIEIA